MKPPRRHRGPRQRGRHRAREYVPAVRSVLHHQAGGEGTGLGLSICHGIVTALGGELSVKSEPGRGNTFRVTLPPAALAGDGAAAGTAPAAASPPTPRARILVIDDDVIGDAVRNTLAREHQVTALSSASEALRRLQAGEDFDLILCDLMMPVMTGMDLHQALLRARPALAGRSRSTPITGYYVPPGRAGSRPGASSRGPRTRAFRAMRRQGNPRWPVTVKHVNLPP